MIVKAIIVQDMFLEITQDILWPVAETDNLMIEEDDFDLIEIKDLEESNERAITNPK